MSKLFLIISALFALVVPDVVNAQQQLPAATQGKPLASPAQ